MCERLDGKFVIPKRAIPGKEWIGQMMEKGQEGQGVYNLAGRRVNLARVVILRTSDPSYNGDAIILVDEKNLIEVESLAQAMNCFGSAQPDLFGP